MARILPKTLADARRFGWNTEGATFDWPTLRDNVAAEVDRLEGLYGQTFANNKVEVFHERATRIGSAWHKTRQWSGNHRGHDFNRNRCLALRTPRARCLNWA